MSWLRTIIGFVADVVRKFTGGNRTMSESTAETTPTPENGKPTTPTEKTVEALTPGFKEYNITQVSELKPLSIEDYVETVLPLALKIEEQFGIYHMVPIVQSAHESRYGNSELARYGLNLFGITATESWIKAGKDVISLPTTEYIKGKAVRTTRGFRRYRNWWDSFLDWHDILSRLNVYKKAYILLRQGRMGAVDGMREMALAYATDPAYAHKLTELYRRLKA